MEKIYRIEENKIVVTDLSQFCIKHILECGQVFRFKRLEELENEQLKYVYEIISLDKKAVIYEYRDKAVIVTKDVEYFINYFDLDTDYNKIKQSLIFDDIMKNATNYGYGIRILRQDIFETIISFIISANNNIKRIQKSVNLISEKFGTKMEDYYAFPSLNQLSKASKSDLRELGVGFRDEYIVSSIKMLENVDFSELKKLETSELANFLKTLKGVGQKVADCIMLFAFYDMSVFPVDTWLKQVYNSFYTVTGCQDVKKIREYFTSKFGKYSGYAQQYLFYYKREM